MEKSTSNRLDQKSELKELSVEKKASIIESILFIAGEAVSLRDIKKAYPFFTVELDEVLEFLLKKYSQESSGIELIVTDDTLQLVSKAQNYDYVRKALEVEQRKPLSKAAYEVLSIIAYNEPITRIEIEEIRGVNSKSAVQRLLDLELIEECGRKEVPGLPYLYKTTFLFLQMAGINSLKELPSFEKFKEKLKDG